MGRTKKPASSISSRKNVQHILPQFNLSEDSSETPIAAVHVDSDNQNVSTERHLDEFDDENTLYNPEVLSSDSEDHLNETTLKDNEVFSNHRRKRNTEKEDTNNARKKSSKLFKLYIA